MSDMYCAGCESIVRARLTDGGEIYPHRPDLHSLPFWRCDACDGFVGCHHKTKNRTAPLGCIANKEMRELRKQIHSTIDPIWKNNLATRKKVYAMMSERVGWSYHTAKTRSVRECHAALEAARQVQAELTTAKGDEAVDVQRRLA